MKLPFLSEFRHLGTFEHQLDEKFLSLSTGSWSRIYRMGRATTRLIGAPKKKLFDRVDKTKNVCYILVIEDSWSL